MDSNDLLVELECPVCTDYLTIPIRQCATGHSVCEKCMRKLKKCALCAREFTQARNITLEGLARKVKYPCINIHDGCDELLAYDKREEHELNCRRGFKVTCPMEGCPFKGDSKALKAHWLYKKSIFKDVQKDVAHLINGYYNFDLMEAFGELFWFKRKSLNNKIYFAVQYIGKSEIASDFHFEVTFSMEKDAKNKLILSHGCSSVTVSDDTLFSDPYYSTVVGFETLHPYVTIKSHDGFQSSYTLKILQEGLNQSAKTSKKPRGTSNESQSGKSNRKSSGKLEESKSQVAHQSGSGKKREKHRSGGRGQSCPGVLNNGQYDNYDYVLKMAEKWVTNARPH